MVCAVLSSRARSTCRLSVSVSAFRSFLSDNSPVLSDRIGIARFERRSGGDLRDPDHLGAHVPQVGWRQDPIGLAGEALPQPVDEGLEHSVALSPKAVGGAV